MKEYRREDLIKEMLEKRFKNSYSLQRSIVTLKKKPTEDSNQNATCTECGVLITVVSDRFGDGTSEYINWVADTWIGECPSCKRINIWIELCDPDIVEAENIRLLRKICDAQLKLLQEDQP
jgi:hypothetical protein